MSDRLGIPNDLLPGHDAWRPKAFEEIDGIWVGPPSSVSFPDSGHETWPGSLDNWWYGHRARIVLAAAERHRRAPRVLWDIGGGTGLMASAFQEAGWATAVVEPIEGAARQATAATDLVFAGLLEDLDLPSRSIPAIGLFDVIEHLDDPAATLRHCQRILSPGGIVVVTVPAIPRLWSATDRAAGHKRRYTKTQLESEASEAGLRVLESQYFFTTLAMAALPVRLMGDRRRKVESDAEILAREARLLQPGRVVDRLLRLVMRAEETVARRVPMPLGLSLLGVLTHP